MFRRKTLAMVAGVAAVAMAVTGCGGSSTTSSGGGGGGTGSSSSAGTLTLGMLVPATTFSAQDMNFANESPYGQAVYDTLLAFFAVLPSLAFRAR